MVLILGRRMNREESGIRDSPAVKRKVLSNEQTLSKFSVLQLSSQLIKLTVFTILYTCFPLLRCLKLTPKL